jgi:hypothetical protein
MIKPKPKLSDLFYIDGKEGTAMYRVTEHDVMQALKRSDIEERIPVLRLEVDYELAVLYEALRKGNQSEIEQSKRRLNKLRREMLLLEV